MDLENCDICLKYNDCSFKTLFIIIGDKLLAYVVKLYFKRLRSNLLSRIVERKVTHSSLYLLISLGITVSVRILLLITLVAPQPIFILLHKRVFFISVQSNFRKADPLFTFHNMVVLINHDIISCTNE